MINGYDNEFEFVKSLNRKHIYELNPMFREFIEDLYGIVNEQYMITCWKNKLPQKTDIFIKINNQIKGISIKKGIKNSVHVERITDFIHFLIENKIDRKNIISYLKYHYADGTTNGKGNYRLSIEEYKNNNQQSIDELNKQLNNKKILNKAIDRFILKGNNSKYYIDAIIYGEVNDFIWILKDNIRKIILSKTNIYSTSVHFGPIICQPKNRCLNNNTKYEKERFCIQLKWYSLNDDIIEFRNNKIIENNKSKMPI